jgi:hypothetical protein
LLLRNTYGIDREAPGLEAGPAKTPQDALTGSGPSTAGSSRRQEPAVPILPLDRRGQL